MPPALANGKKCRRKERKREEEEPIYEEIDATAQAPVHMCLFVCVIVCLIVVPCHCCLSIRVCFSLPSVDLLSLCFVACDQF